MRGVTGHYIMDVPSPKFSSVIGEDEADDERAEIIRCLLEHDSHSL